MIGSFLGLSQLLFELQQLLALIVLLLSCPSVCEFLAQLLVLLVEPLVVPLKHLHANLTTSIIVELAHLHIMFEGMHC